MDLLAFAAYLASCLRLFSAVEFVHKLAKEKQFTIEDACTAASQRLAQTQEPDPVSDNKYTPPTAKEAGGKIHADPLTTVSSLIKACDAIEKDPKTTAQLFERREDLFGGGNKSTWSVTSQNLFADVSKCDDAHLPARTPTNGKGWIPCIRADHKEKDLANIQRLGMVMSWAANKGRATQGISPNFVAAVHAKIQSKPDTEVLAQLEGLGDHSSSLSDPQDIAMIDHFITGLDQGAVEESAKLKTFQITAVIERYLGRQ